MDKLNIIDIKIIKCDKPYLKYTIKDLNNNIHIFNVKSKKQLEYIINDLQIMKKI